MSDLIERLRAYQQADADGVMVTVSRQACDEAADEIERLQRQLDAGTEAGWHALRNERDALRTECASWKEMYHAERARIEGAPFADVFEATNGTGLVYATGGLPREWIGKRVALVVLEGGES